MWYIVESQVGFVAANIPSMGPLFSKVGMVAKKLRHSSASRNLEYSVTKQSRGVDDFEQMTDDDRLMTGPIAKVQVAKEDQDAANSVPLKDMTDREQCSGSWSSNEALNQNSRTIEVHSV